MYFKVSPFVLHSDCMILIFPCHFRVNAQVLKLLKCDLKLCPDLFMGGPFFAVVAKEAGLRIVHLDWNDDRAIYTFIFVVGDWERGSIAHLN